MIVDLPTTNSSKINKALVDMRDQGGSVALGRVLTLVIITDEAETEDPIAAANAASFEHPCRVIVVALGSKRASPRMDAQIRVGGDAGASEVVVLRLYGSLVDHGASVVVPLLLADAPVVVWWPGDAPEIPAEDPIGMLAQRRITDAASSKRPNAQMAKRRASYRPGDTDLSWTRITRWRGLLASTMDQPPHEKVLSATVAGAADSPSADLLAAWLALALKVPVKRVKSATKAGPGLHSVVLTRRGGDISLVRPQTVTAELKVANQPERHVALPRRGLRDCLSEELRRLDADDVYAEVLTKGMALVEKYATSESKAGAARASTAKSDGDKAGGAKGGAARASGVKTGATRAGGARADGARADGARAGGARAGGARTGGATAGGAGTGGATAGATNAGDTEGDATNAGATKAGAASAGATKAGAVRAGAGKADPTATEPTKNEPTKRVRAARVPVKATAATADRKPRSSAAVKRSAVEAAAAGVDDLPTASAPAGSSKPSDTASPNGSPAGSSARPAAGSADGPTNGSAGDTSPGDTSTRGGGAVTSAAAGEAGSNGAAPTRRRRAPKPTGTS